MTLIESSMLAIADVREKLDGKRLALQGFDAAGAETTGAALESAGAFCRVISASAAADLSRFDGVIAYLASPAETSLDALAGSGKPILAVAPFAVLAEALPAIRKHGIEYIGYPFPPEELLLRMYASITAGRAGAAVTARPRIALIADDDPSILALVRATLGNKEIQCHLAEDGAAALRMAREIRPSVVVLDVNMPQLDGFEVLTALRNEKATASMRVLMLTGCEQERDTVRAFGLGADDYLVKPFNPMELAVRVLRLFEVYR